MPPAPDKLAQSSLNARNDHADSPFLPSIQLKQLLDREQATLDGCLLSLPDGRRYALQDAVRIVGNAKQETDPYGLTGVVLTVGRLLRRGFSLNASQAALGRIVYDLETGYLAQPLSDQQAGSDVPAGPEAPEAMVS